MQGDPAAVDSAAHPDRIAPDVTSLRVSPGQRYVLPVHSCTVFRFGAG